MEFTWIEMAGIWSVISMTVWLILIRVFFDSPMID